MSRFGVGTLTGAGSTTLPIISLVGGTTVVARVREIGVFNTSSTAVALKLCRLTTAGTPGSALTRSILNAVDPTAAVATAFGTYTSTGPTLVDLGYRTVLGAAPGSGTIWTFDDWELTVAAVASQGVGIVVENGTGQACQAYIKWTE